MRTRRYNLVSREQQIINEFGSPERVLNQTEDGTPTSEYNFYSPFTI